MWRGRRRRVRGVPASGSAPGLPITCRSLIRPPPLVPSRQGAWCHASSQDERSAIEPLLGGRGPHQSRRAAVPPAPMAAPASRSTPRMDSFVQHVLDSYTSFSTGACSEADVPHVPSLSCAGDRHGILPQEASPLDAVELSVCEAVRARRWCDTRGGRRRAGGLAHGSHPCWSARQACRVSLCGVWPGPVAACGAIEALPRPQRCLTRTPGLHTSNAGADGGQVAPGTAATPCPWTILPIGVTMAANLPRRLRRCAPSYRGERA
jgi:hypothetical protein